MIVLHPNSSYIPIMNFKLHYYSVFMFLAILAGYFCTLKFSDIFKTTEKEIIIEFAPYMVLISILGARFYYVLLSLDYYLLNPISAFYIWNGGLSIHGAILAGIIFGIIYFKKKKLNFLNYADIFTLSLPIGQFIGRWGNFFNQEAFGKPAYNSPVALLIDKPFRPEKYINRELFHPTFLYESILNLIIFCILFFIMKKTAPKRSGFVFFSYILLYSIVRALIEPIRLDSVLNIGNMPFALLVSILGILTGLIGLIVLSIKTKP